MTDLHSDQGGCAAVARCHPCGGLVALAEAVKVDVQQVSHGEHWAWAHPSCSVEADEEER